MKSQFPGYFSPSADEMKKLWDDAFIACDASVLLDLYRYSKETRDQVFTVLGAIAARLWLPNQAAYEFLENRLEVISDQAKAYAEAKTSFEKLEKGFKNARRHPFIDSRIMDELSLVIGKAYKDLDTKEGEFRQLQKEDGIQDKILGVFNEKVGKPFDQKKLEDIYKEGEKRFKEKVPPGYEDEKKPGNRKYGDLMIWLQIIEKACHDKKPAIFVTSDAKEDWWRIFNGWTYGPRPELIAEFQSKAGVPLHIYKPEKFVEYAQEHLKQKVSKEAVQEIEDLAKKPQWPQGLVKWFVPELKDAFADQIAGLITSQLDIDLPVAGSVHPPSIRWKLSQEDLTKLRQCFAAYGKRPPFGFEDLFHKVLWHSLSSENAEADVPPDKGLDPNQITPPEPNQEPPPPAQPPPNPPENPDTPNSP